MPALALAPAAASVLCLYVMVCSCPLARPLRFVVVCVGVAVGSVALPTINAGRRGPIYLYTAGVVSSFRKRAARAFLHPFVPFSYDSMLLGRSGEIPIRTISYHFHTIFIPFSHHLVTI